MQTAGHDGPAVEAGGLPPPVSIAKGAALAALLLGHHTHPRPQPRSIGRIPIGWSPAIVSERLVGLGHLVHVLTTLHRSTETVARVEDLICQSQRHRLLSTLPAVADEPADGESGRPARTHLDRHLIRGAADPARPHLELRLDVLD